MTLTEIKALNEEEKKIQINNYKTEIDKLSNIIAKLSVPYNDINVLLDNSQELEFVNYFFDSISCGDKGIETLLYEVIGYSLFKTSKLNKAFIFKGKGRNRKV